MLSSSKWVATSDRRRVGGRCRWCHGHALTRTSSSTSKRHTPRRPISHPLPSPLPLSLLADKKLRRRLLFLRPSKILPVLRAKETTKAGGRRTTRGKNFLFREDEVGSRDTPGSKSSLVVGAAAVSLLLLLSEASGKGRTRQQAWRQLKKRGRGGGSL